MGQINEENKLFEISMPSVDLFEKMVVKYQKKY